MKRSAWRLRDGRELRGQLVPLSHLSGRLPTGNTGRAGVSAFRPMRIAPDLQRLIEPVHGELGAERPDL